MISLSVEIFRDETRIDYLKIFHHTPQPENLLIELRLSDSRLAITKPFAQSLLDRTVLDIIIIEWLTSQNPYQSFHGQRNKLIGQAHPGLGTLKYLMEMMLIIGSEVCKDGFLDIPDHVHGAIMYARKFKFFNPEHEGLVRAVIRDLGRFDLPDISWGFFTQTIIDRMSGKPVCYQPSEQVFPLSERLRHYFASRRYQQAYREIYKNLHLQFRYEEMRERRDEFLRKGTGENI